MGSDATGSFMARTTMWSIRNKCAESAALITPEPAFPAVTKKVTSCIVATMFVLMLSPNEATRYFVQVAYLVYGLMFAAVLHIADYTSYRDVFHAGETLAPLDRPARGA